MSFSVNLPIADRRVSYDFYTQGLGLEPVGALADDGMPEPLQFAVGTSALIMLVPSTGFSWAIGERRITDASMLSCVLSLKANNAPDVTAAVQRAVNAGASVVVAPQAQPWGVFAATFTDPDRHLWMVSATAGD